MWNTAQQNASFQDEASTTIFTELVITKRNYLETGRRSTVLFHFVLVNSKTVRYKAITAHIVRGIRPCAILHVIEFRQYSKRRLLGF